MKIWLKYLIGVALGVALSFALPSDSAAAHSVFTFLTGFAIRIGRYLVVPLVFTGCASAVFVLRDTKKLVVSTGVIFAVIASSSLLLTIIGMISVLVVRLPRIPITVEKVTDASTLDIREILSAIFPYSPLEALINGSFLLPAVVLACLIGAACVSDKNKSKPVVTLIDALANISYYCMSFIMDIMPIGMIAIACSWSINYFSVIVSGVLTPLIILLTVDFIVVVCVVYPVIFYFGCKGHHPFRLLYASLASIIAAFFSGDTNYALSFHIRHGTESLGVRRRINGFAYPLFSIFARGGSAMVVAVSFVVILHSYSTLRIPFDDILWITFVSFGLSFLLCAHPTGGAYIALTVLCAMYGRGFEAVYLLLKPAAAIICAYAAAIDAATTMFGSYFVSYTLKLSEHRDLRHFI
jgi:Na+/H+-dicarboxylate symporter